VKERGVICYEFNFKNEEPGRGDGLKRTGMERKKNGSQGEMGGGRDITGIKTEDRVQPHRLLKANEGKKAARLQGDAGSGK